MREFFEPKNVAVVGASRDPGKIGHVILRNFKEGFLGKIYPVNPNAEEILGLECFPNISDIPGKSLDLAVIAVRADLVPGVFEDAVKKKLKAAIVVSGGFREIGRADLEEKIRRISAKNRIRVVGPNCIGVFDAYSHVDTLFLPRYRLERPRAGRIGFLTQSGAVGAAILDWAAFKGFGVSKFVSYGNALDVNETNSLEYLGKDPKTRVVVMYIEGVKHGREFMKAAKRVSNHKPVIAIKAGKTEAGMHAASSHTASLAGADEVYSAAFEQSGVIRASDMEQAFDFARVLAEQPPSHGDRVCIVTNGGGYGVMAADAVEEQGLRISRLDEKTIKTIREDPTVPPYAVIGNPMDLVGDADSARYRIALENALEDKNVDAIMCIILMQTAGVESEIIDVVTEISDRKKKPIVVSGMGGSFTQLHMRMLEKEGVPTFRTPERAAAALRCLFEYGYVLVGAKNRPFCTLD